MSPTVLHQRLLHKKVEDHFVQHLLPGSLEHINDGTHPVRKPWVATFVSHQENRVQVCMIKKTDICKILKIPWPHSRM